MSPTPPLQPWPGTFLEALWDQEEVLVSSRGDGVVGTVPMWFAVIPPGFVYLLTPAFTKKAERWRLDPWVRLRVRGGGPVVEGEVEAVGWSEAQNEVERLTSRFRLAGAATPQALRWMLEDGSRRLLRSGRRKAPGPGPH
ncbi:MAG: hypothetical protein ACREOL_10295 [Candidatus Dormibacteria bacterium]